MFEQVKMLYIQNPAAGGELAVSLMEHVLTGDHSSDDFMVAFAIANHKETIQKAQHNYDVSKENKRSAIEDDLRQYTELYVDGFTQAEIAKRMNTTQSNVSKKIAKARKDFPHLLQKEEYSKNIPEYSEYEQNIPNIPNEEYIPNIPNIPKNNEADQEYIPNIPVFQKFQHVYVNENVNVNVNDNVSGKSSTSPHEGSALDDRPKPKFDF